MGNKIKIALCLSGEPRSTMASFPYIYESFLQKDNRYEVDVYIHSWKGFRALELYNPKKYLINPIGEAHSNFINFIDNINISSKDVIQKLSPYNTLTPNIHPLKNVFLMFLSIKECFSLINETYDLYIRCRLDLFLNNKINLSNLLPLFTLGIDVITGIKYNQNSGQEIIDDQLAICNYNGFKTYSNTIINLESLLSQSQSLSPEILLGTHLTNHKIKLYPYNFNHYPINSNKIFSSYPNFKDE